MIVVLGGRGYVGQAIQSELQRRGLAFEVFSRARLDYTQPHLLSAALRALPVRFLINAAGYTGRPNVDACERAKAECLAGNAVLPGVVADVCSDLKLLWGHVSSGCIYSGAGPDGHGFTELDAPNFSFRQNNCSFYSGCKALGEEVLAGRDNCFVWRLRIPFNHQDGSRNYLSKLLRYSRLLDATNSISHLGECVAAFVDCWQHHVAPGIYNLTNPGSVTTRQVFQAIRDSGVSDRQATFFESEQQFMSVAAVAPRSNCVLNVSKALQAGLQLRPVEEAIADALRTWQWEKG